MFQIVVVPSNSTANTALSFKSQTNFDIARKNIHEKMKMGDFLIVQSDDAGQTVEIQANNISYVMGIDVLKQQEFALWAKAVSQAPKNTDAQAASLEEFMAAENAKEDEIAA